MVEILCNADEFEAEFDVRGVNLTSPEGELVLVGSEDDVVSLLDRIANLYNARVSYRDPGPDVRLAHTAFGVPL